MKRKVVAVTKLGEARIACQSFGRHDFCGVGVTWLGWFKRRCRLPHSWCGGSNEKRLASVNIGFTMKVRI